MIGWTIQLVVNVIAAWQIGVWIGMGSARVRIYFLERRYEKERSAKNRAFLDYLDYVEADIKRLQSKEIA